MSLCDCCKHGNVCAGSNADFPVDSCSGFEPELDREMMRTKFGTGAVRDLHIGKGRFDLLPWAAIWEVAKHCERGAERYGEHNVDKGIPTHSLLDSAFRHLCRYMLGETDEPHLVAAAWNVLWAVQMECLKPEMQDIPTREMEGRAAIGGGVSPSSVSSADTFPRGEGFGRKEGGGDDSHS